MRSIEVFTGAGGLALGTHRAGFHHLAVVENDRNSCDTLRLNVGREAQTHVVWPVAPMDIAAFDCAPYRGGLDLLAGGPPCQPWSLGGKHGGKDDHRNLFPELFRMVRELRPRALLIENVRGMTREVFRPYLDYILAQARCPFVAPLPGEAWEAHKERLDAQYGTHIASSPDRYDVSHTVVNAANFGVPQQRHRVFIVAFRSDLRVRWSFPAPTHSEDALLFAQYVDGTYWCEHDLAPCPAPPRLTGRVARLAAKPKPLISRWRTVRDAISDLPEPIDHTPHPEYDNHVGIPDARPYPGHTGSPWDAPAKAIKAGDHGNPGGENMLRRDDDTVRYFTVRELARLQTFPDEWHFANSWTESRRQLGNAVPVVLAEVFAARVRDELDGVDGREREKHERTLLDVAD